MKLSPLTAAALLCWGLAAGSATAAPLSLAKVVSAYHDCSLTDEGDGTSTLAVTLDFNQAEGNTGGNTLLSRGLMLTAYDQHGVPQSITPLFSMLDGIEGSGYIANPDYVLIHGQREAWDNVLAHRARAAVKIRNADLADWPAVTIRAANYVAGDDVADVSGGAYITAAAKGTCSILKDPASPPPFDINISIDVPDWDLGEIQPGEQWIPLGTSRDRLCLHYTDAEIDAKPFIINASNQNGVADRHYQLKNPDARSQAIPYQLILENGSLQVLLPNDSGASIPLDKGGRTCFSPLFRTVAPKSIQQGDYSDVLTFTVVTPA